jgi:hypothetical protein
MRRAYISPHVNLQTSYRLAKAWAGGGSKITIVGSNTSALEASPWLAQTGLPMGTTSNRHSRYTAQARTGILIAWCLDLVEILNIERRSELSGLVVVRGHKNHSRAIVRGVGCGGHGGPLCSRGAGARQLH